MCTPQITTAAMNIFSGASDSNGAKATDGSVQQVASQVQQLAGSPAVANDTATPAPQKADTDIATSTKPNAPTNQTDATQGNIPTIATKKQAVGPEGRRDRGQTILTRPIGATAFDSVFGNKTLIGG